MILCPCVSVASSKNIGVVECSTVLSYGMTVYDFGPYSTYHKTYVYLSIANFKEHPISFIHCQIKKAFLQLAPSPKKIVQWK